MIVRRCVVLAALALVVAGCGNLGATWPPSASQAAGQQGGVVHRSGQLVDVAATKISSSCELSWQGMEGTAMYEVLVHGSDGSIWTWDGTATKVTYGAGSIEPLVPATAPLDLQAGVDYSWMVTAYADDGSTVGSSPVAKFQFDGGCSASH